LLPYKGMETRAAQQLRFFPDLQNMKGVVFLAFLMVSCSTVRIKTPPRSSSLTGTAYYKSLFASGWQQRDSVTTAELLRGNMPAFLKRLVPIRVSAIDSATGKKIKAVYFVTPDYLSVGTDADWARVHLTPGAAQKVADSLHCFLPTTKMVDAIYHAAKLKLEPLPLFAHRDSTPTMYHHHLIIEGQRKGRKGLIAGIKKDLVITGRLHRDSRSNRVAIYGWHKPGGVPIQPLYTGHVNWWVDYSQGIRLVYRKIKMNGQWMDYTDVLKHPVYKNLICNEEFCDYYRYPY